MISVFFKPNRFYCIVPMMKIIVYRYYNSYVEITLAN